MKRTAAVFLVLITVLFSENSQIRKKFPEITKNKDGTLNYIKDTKVPSFFEPISGSEDIEYNNMGIYNKEKKLIAKMELSGEYSYIKAVEKIYPEDVLYKEILFEHFDMNDYTIIRPEGIVNGNVIVRVVNGETVAENDLFTEPYQIIEFEYPSYKVTSIYTDGRKETAVLENGNIKVEYYDKNGALTEKAEYKF
jgi:hypothetical protein